MIHVKIIHVFAEFAAGLSRCQLPRQSLSMILRIGNKRLTDLTRLGDALDPIRLGLGFAQDRQQHCSQHADDGNDHKQLHYCEASFPRLGLNISRAGHGLHSEF